MVQNFSRLAEVFPEETYLLCTSLLFMGEGQPMKITIDSFGDGYQGGMKKTTLKEVAFIKNWINNYPKKCLDLQVAE